MDGAEAESIRYILELELGRVNSSNSKGPRCFDAMGGYADAGNSRRRAGADPCDGNSSDPPNWGQVLPLHFVATIYGVAFANLIFSPVANKIKSLVHQQTHYREMLIEGIVAIRRR